MALQSVCRVRMEGGVAFIHTCLVGPVQVPAYALFKLWEHVIQPYFFAPKFKVRSPASRRVGPAPLPLFIPLLICQAQPITAPHASEWCPGLKCKEVQRAAAPCCAALCRTPPSPRRTARGEKRRSGRRRAQRSSGAERSTMQRAAAFGKCWDRKHACRVLLRQRKVAQPIPGSALWHDGTHLSGWLTSHHVQALCVWAAMPPTWRSLRTAGERGRSGTTQRSALTSAW